jgi:hypothetical protein
VRPKKKRSVPTDRKLAARNISDTNASDQWNESGCSANATVIGNVSASTPSTTVGPCAE